MEIKSLKDELDFWIKELREVEAKRNLVKQGYSRANWIKSSEYFVFKRQTKKIKLEINKRRNRYENIRN